MGGGKHADEPSFHWLRETPCNVWVEVSMQMSLSFHWFRETPCNVWVEVSMQMGLGFHWFRETPCNSSSSGGGKHEAIPTGTPTIVQISNS